MRKDILSLSALVFPGLMPFQHTTLAQTKGLRTITEKEQRYNLEFLGARVFR